MIEELFRSLTGALGSFSGDYFEAGEMTLKGLLGDLCDLCGKRFVFR